MKMTVLRGVTSCTLAVRYSLFSCVHKNRTTQTPDFPYSLLVKYQRTGVTFYSSILRKGSRCLQNTGLCLSHYPSIHPSIHPFIHPPTHPSIRLSSSYLWPACLSTKQHVVTSQRTMQSLFFNQFDMPYNRDPALGLSRNKCQTLLSRTSTKFSQFLWSQW